MTKIMYKIIIACLIIAFSALFLLILFDSMTAVPSNNTSISNAIKVTPNQTVIPSGYIIASGTIENQNITLNASGGAMAIGQIQNGTIETTLCGGNKEICDDLYNRSHVVIASASNGGSISIGNITFENGTVKAKKVECWINVSIPNSSCTLG